MSAAGIFLNALVLAAAIPAISQQTSASKWISLSHLSTSEMSSPDAARMRAEHGAIATEAAFFGYDLSVPGWQVRQTVCPAISDDLLLHYRRIAHTGAQSLFTALVPRVSGRIRVVPVLYRNAVPFKSAVGSEHSLSVFNRAVPATVALKDLQPEGSWLQLGLCYAEIVGAEPSVPRDTETNPALLHAPSPTLRISEENHTAGVIFMDRNAPHSYTVWNICFDSHGRAVAATATSLTDYAAPVVHGEEPLERPLPPGTQPNVIPLPPPNQQKAKPLPH